jgi:hypothetical protein
MTRAHLAPFLDRLLQADALDSDLAEILGRIPSQWQVDSRTRAGLRAFLSARAAYLTDNFCANLERVVRTTAT